MIRFLCAVAATVLSLTPAFASRHVWTGAVNGNFSNPSNWSGGSPVSDPEAELSFPSSVAQTTLTNDLVNLTVQAIDFSAPGYVISGNPIRIAAEGSIIASPGTARIACDLVLKGGVTVVGNLTIAGTISGIGPVTKIGPGAVTFAGDSPNTYSGATQVNGGTLELAKPNFVNAIPGSLHIHGATATATNSEQIADSAAIELASSAALYIPATETIGPLSLSGITSIHTSTIGLSSYPGNLILGGDVTVTETGSYLNGNILLPATRTFDVTGELHIASLFETLPGAGVVFRGNGTADVRGFWTGPTTVEGSAVALNNVSTPVTLRGGEVSGTVASLTATGGTVRSLSVTGDFRVGAGATFAPSDTEYGYSVTSVHTGNVVRVGGTLDPQISVSVLPGHVHTVVHHAGTQPVAGAFTNAPEGAIVEGFRVSYVGGDGNDVTLTDARRNPSYTYVNVSGAFYPGETLTVDAYVGTSTYLPTGTVTFREGNTILATVALDTDSRASTTFVPQAEGEYTISATYSGEDTFEPSQATMTFTVGPRPPSIATVQPLQVNGGEAVTVTVTGSGFDEGAVIVISGVELRTTRISSTELQAAWTPPKLAYQWSASVQVRLPNVSSDSLSITVKAVPVQASPFTFEMLAVTGPVTPGAQSVWLRAGYFYNPYRSAVEGTSIVDSDNDGVVRWTFADPIISGSLFVMVDVQSGEVTVGTTDDVSPHPKTQQAKFVRGTNGAFSNVLLDDNNLGTHHMHWVRPGVGAWRLSGSTSPIRTSTAQPLGAAPVPAGIEPGDVVVAAFAHYGWYGGVVDEHIQTGPGVLAFGAATPTTVNESDGVVTLTIERTGGADGAVSVNYTTVDDTARAGVNYAARAETITFAEGELVKTIDIPLINDAVYGNDVFYGGNQPSFKVRLSDPVDATLGTNSEMTVVVNEDDPLPVVAIGPDVSIQEGDGETRQITFALTLTGSTRVPVDVRWSSRTNPGLWNEGGELTFAPGETQKQVTVSFKGDTLVEPDGWIKVNIDNAWPAIVTRHMATVTIADDDDYAGITILDANVSESNGTARVLVQLSKYSARPVTVSYGTESVTAFSGRDYTRLRGTITLNDRAEIVVPILNDTLAEGDESFAIVLSEPISGRLVRNSAVVVIADDDHGVLPSISAEPVRVQERNDQAAKGLVTFKLSEPTNKEVRFYAVPTNGTAVSGSDFQWYGSWTVVIPAGQTSVTREITLLDDRNVEPSETFTLQLSDPVNATLAQTSVTCTIDDDDGVQPVLGVEPVRLFEGDSGASQARFVLRLTKFSLTPVTVSWKVLAGSADFTDVQEMSGSVVFDYGETTKIVAVNVMGDSHIEPDETFTLKVTSAPGLTIGQGSATGTIVNDDHPPKPAR